MKSKLKTILIATIVACSAVSLNQTTFAGNPPSIPSPKQSKNPPNNPSNDQNVIYKIVNHLFGNFKKTLINTPNNPFTNQSENPPHNKNKIVNQLFDDFMETLINTPVEMLSKKFKKYKMLTEILSPPTKEDIAELKKITNHEIYKISLDYKSLKKILEITLNRCKNSKNYDNETIKKTENFMTKHINCIDKWIEVLNPDLIKECISNIIEQEYTSSFYKKTYKNLLKSTENTEKPLEFKNKKLEDIEIIVKSIEKQEKFTKENEKTLNPYIKNIKNLIQQYENNIKTYKTNTVVELDKTDKLIISNYTLNELIKNIVKLMKNIPRSISSTKNIIERVQNKMSEEKTKKILENVEKNTEIDKEKLKYSIAKLIHELENFKKFKQDMTFDISILKSQYC